MDESYVYGPFQWQNWQCACAVSRDRVVGVIQNHIFGISDPNFPIYHITFMGLQRWLRRVHMGAPPL